MCRWLPALHYIQLYKWYCLCGQYGGSHLRYKRLVCWKCAKLNDDKAEMLIIGSKYHIKICQIPQIPDLHVGSSVMTPAFHVKYLGVIMDFHFTMEPHIDNIMRAAFFKIRKISYYRRFLTPSCAKTLIHAHITSKLDYCNGLLYGLPSQQLTRL